MIEVKGKKYLKEIVSKELIVKHQRNIKNAFANHGKRVTKALEKKIKTGSRTGRVYFFRGKQHKALCLPGCIHPARFVVASLLLRWRPYSLAL